MTASIIAAGTSALSSTQAALRRGVAAIGAWWQAQRDYHRLCQMEDSALKDLGLSRSDLRDATAVGIFGDPTLIIAGRAEERLGRRRGGRTDR